MFEALLSVANTSNVTDRAPRPSHLQTRFLSTQCRGNPGLTEGLQDVGPSVNLV